MDVLYIHDFCLYLIPWFVVFSQIYISFHFLKICTNGSVNSALLQTYWEKS